MGVSGVSVQACMVGNGVARRSDVELFTSYAHPELQEAPPWTRGVCFNPGCRSTFEPSRDWQMYCCTACERAGNAEFRCWGHRMAFPMLVWRMGKYERDDAAVIARTRSARRFVTRLQSQWLAERESA